VGDFACYITMLALTMRFWRLWFPWIPAYLGIRSLGLLFLVPFGSPVVSVAWTIIFPALMFLMAYLSIPFSKRNCHMTIVGRVALFVTLISFLLATSQLFIVGTQNSVLMFSGAGDIALISALRSKRVQQEQDASWLGATYSRKLRFAYAEAASGLPNGRKYCFPLMVG